MRNSSRPPARKSPSCRPGLSSSPSRIAPPGRAGSSYVLIFTLGRSYGYLHRFTVMPVRNTGHVFRRVPGPAVRILIGAALLGGSVTAYGFFMSAHPGLWNHSDEYIYWAAGRMVRANPAAVYHVLYGGPREYKLPFTYPPFAAWA